MTRLALTAASALALLSPSAVVLGETEFHAVPLTGKELKRAQEAGIVEVDPDGTQSSAPAESMPDPATIQPRDASLPCENLGGDCNHWALQGECWKNPSYMLHNCPHSCGVCSRSTDAHYYGTEQEVAGVHSADIMKALRRAKEYVRGLPQSALKNCVYKNKLCGFWAATGECEANWNHMAIDCSPVCETCERIASFEFKGGDEFRGDMTSIGS